MDRRAGNVAENCWLMAKAKAGAAVVLRVMRRVAMALLHCHFTATAPYGGSCRPELRQFPNSVVRTFLCFVESLR